VDCFAAIADPTRRRIIDHLRHAEADVGQLVVVLGISQPLASKHLKVLREAGVVASAVSGKRRIYRLSHDPLPEVLAWVTPYYRMWSTSLDRLENALNKEENRDR
jgi:DNA-binding transcriptional ArsR family regulator